MISYDNFKKLIEVLSDRDVVEYNVEQIFGKNCGDTYPLFDPFYTLTDMYLLETMNDQQFEYFYDYVYSNYNNFTDLLNCDGVEDFYNYLRELENE
jgi:hypothetical protein